MSRSRIVAGVCAATLSTAAVVAASDAATSTKYSASLSGAQEVPGNASRATGKATLTVTGRKLCYVVTSSNLREVPQAGHIHKGAKGKAGAVYIALFGKPKPLKNGRISGCVTTTAAKLKAVASKPGAYYANIHTIKYPAGVMRGQLKKG